jgi:hypothetical protein
MNIPILKKPSQLTNTLGVTIIQIILPSSILLNIKSSRHKDLVQKADEEKDKNSNEAEKWRKRTTELLQNEEELKAELDKVKKENKMKEPQNQYTQTEVRYYCMKYKNSLPFLIGDIGLWNTLRLRYTIMLL